MMGRSDERNRHMKRTFALTMALALGCLGMTAAAQTTPAEHGKKKHEQTEKKEKKGKKEKKEKPPAEKK